jgi:hypothetical protein
MSGIETEAKPILTPLILGYEFRHQMSAEEHVILAAWVTLRSMLWDSLAPPTATRYYTVSERARFNGTLTPPANTRIWLAPFAGTPHSAQFHVINNVRIGENYGIHCTTAVINHIAIQLYTWRGHKRTIRTSVMNRHGWDKATRPVWPVPKRVVSWPPPQYLNDEGFETLRGRFRMTRPGTSH